MKQFTTLAIAFGALVFTTAAANAALITDGDFSVPSGGVTFTTYDSGDSFGGWNVTQGSVDLIGGYWQTPGPNSTSGSVDLDGTQPGAIAQNLTLNAGTYVLTFSLSGNPDGGFPALVTTQVSAGNATQDFSYNITADSSKTNMGYITESMAFTTTGNTTLTFKSLDASGAFGPVIGNVQLSEVPLPASVTAFLIGLAGLFGMHAYNKRKIAA